MLEGISSKACVEQEMEEIEKGEQSADPRTYLVTTKSIKGLAVTRCQSVFDGCLLLCCNNLNHERMQISSDDLEF